MFNNQLLFIKLLKRLLIFIISVAFPPIGIFLILREKDFNQKGVRIVLISVLLILSTIAWAPTYPKIYRAYVNYRKPLTPELNEKHRQTIESLYNEYMDLKDNYSNSGNPKNSEEIHAWHDRFCNELSSYETREEFSEEHENVYDYFNHLYSNLYFSNIDVESKVSEEKANLMELYIKAIIDEDSEASIIKEAIETDTKTIDKKEEPITKSSILESNVVLSSVNYDTTGKWKKVLISEDISIKDKALDYYKTYFNNDSEIHAIVNFANKTTTKISVLGTYLDVTTYEYVKGEENDANLMFSGMLLKEYFVDINTGEIEEIQ